MLADDADLTAECTVPEAQNAEQAEITTNTPEGVLTDVTLTFPITKQGPTHARGAAMLR